MIFPKRLNKISLFMTTSNNNYIFKPVEFDGIKNCKQKFYILILFNFFHKL